MIKKYSIENLSKIFLEHSKIAEQNRLRDLQKFPDAEYLKDDFNIAKALHHICEELIRMKNDD